MRKNEQLYKERKALSKREGGWNKHVQMKSPGFVNYTRDRPTELAITNMSMIGIR